MIKSYSFNASKSKDLTKREHEFETQLLKSGNLAKSSSARSLIRVVNGNSSCTSCNDHNSRVDAAAMIMRRSGMSATQRSPKLHLPPLPSSVNCIYNESPLIYTVNRGGNENCTLVDSAKFRKHFLTMDINNNNNQSEDLNHRQRPCGSVSSSNDVSTTSSSSSTCSSNFCCDSSPTVSTKSGSGDEAAYVKPIVSRQGSIRGNFNHVKQSLKQLYNNTRDSRIEEQTPLSRCSSSFSVTVLNNSSVNSSPKSQTNPPLVAKTSSNLLIRNFDVEERDKIVVYTTSLQIVRSSFDKSKKVKKILQNHCVRYEERDLNKNKDAQRELKYRLNISQIDLPHLFFNGKHVGLEVLSDQGVLQMLFKDIEKIRLRIYCYKCGGYRFVLCTLCNGSKKIHHNFKNLKCTSCNEDGLVRCDQCLDQQE